MKFNSFFTVLFSIPTSYFVKQYGGKMELWLEGQLHRNVNEEMLISWTPYWAVCPACLHVLPVTSVCVQKCFCFNLWPSIFSLSAGFWAILKWQEEGEYILIKCALHMKLLFIGSLLSLHTSKQVKQASMWTGQSQTLLYTTNWVIQRWIRGDLQVQETQGIQYCGRNKPNARYVMLRRGVYECCEHF